MSSDLETILMIDERINVANRRVASMATVVSVDSGVVMVVEDGSDNAVPINVLGHVLPYPDDRVLIVKGAAEWSIVGSPRPTYKTAHATRLLPTVTLLASAATVSFDNIPQNHLHLRLIAKVRATTGGDGQVGMRFNGDTSAIYEYVRVHYDTAAGAHPAAATATTSIQYGLANNSGDPGGYFALAIVDIPNYVSAVHDKHISGRFGTLGNPWGVSGGYWGNTAAITSIQLGIGTGSYEIGSTFDLYGFD